MDGMSRIHESETGRHKKTKKQQRTMGIHNHGLAMMEVCGTHSSDEADVMFVEQRGPTKKDGIENGGLTDWKLNLLRNKK